MFEGDLDGVVLRRGGGEEEAWFERFDGGICGTMTGSPSGGWRIARRGLLDQSALLFGGLLRAGYRGVG